MLPKEPPRRPQLGFLYAPPYRIQGVSIAGEATAIQVPELDLGFDIGECPRAMLSSNIVALSHGHMDHIAALIYYFSQRNFQGMGVGKIVCHPDLAEPIHNLMNALVGIERQRTPYEVVTLKPEEQMPLKGNVVLRAFSTVHTVPSLGYACVELRSKLRADLVGMPQEQLVKLKDKGEEITETHEIPLVTYMGDTLWGNHFDRPEVLDAKVLITECTFIEPGHRKRAAIGKHLHLDDIVRLLDMCNCESVILTHLSRRTNLSEVRKVLDGAIPARHRDRVHVLMDTRANRARYERQLAEAAAGS
ncbi:MAG: MBL fold metallo-hydrolase [Planctomycetota bacterium]